MEPEKVEVMRVSSAEIVGAQVSAEIDIQISTAKKFPRNIKEFKEKCTELATFDEVTAEKCLFVLPSRGGGKIEGKSIRLAELVAHTYGNLRIQSRLVEEGEGHVTVQGICHDLETNVAFSGESRMNILTSNKKRYSPDMVTMIINAASAKAQRNAIFKCVPEVLINEVENGIKKKMLLDDSVFVERKDFAFKRLEEFGVPKARILDLLEIGDETQITQAHLITLRGIVNGIMDKEFTAEGVLSGLQKRNDAQEFKAEAHKKKNADPAPAAGKNTAAKKKDINSSVGADDAKFGEA